MKTKILSAILLLAVSVGASAQSLKSGYFTEGFTYRHQINPAFQPERRYVSFPVLGNMNIGLNGNVGLSTFLYESKKPGYDLTTFLSNEVSSETFLSKLKGKNRIGADINMQIFSFGMPMLDGFFTFDLGVHADMRMTMPKDLFVFMKKGMSSDVTRYSLSNIGASANSYVQIAPGYSRKINDKLTVGGKLKFLVGLAQVNAQYDNLDITMSQDRWLIQSQGYIQSAIKGYGLTFKENEEGYMAIDGFDETTGGMGPTGFGMAIDLGATYQLLDDLQLSASITDIGFMSWKNVTRADAASEFLFDGFEGIVTDEDDPAYEGNSIDDQMEQLGDDLEDFFRFRENKSKTKSTKALAATLNIGAEYVFPYYDKLTFAFLSSTRINGKYSSSEGRFYANVAPVNWFEASINYACSSYGSSFGWLLNFHPRGFNFFIGSDTQFFKVSPQFIPVGRANANISFGINFPFGELID